MKQPDNKIKVFISSKIGDTPADEKYIVARKAVKEILESTNLFSVYSFEDKGASIIPAGEHYIRGLINSDVCIFLIDNKDGVPHGVQVELDTADKYKKPSLYYFCNQWESKKTQVQLSLEKAKYPKHRSIVSFASFVEKCPGDLMESVLDSFIGSVKPLKPLEDVVDNMIAEEEIEEEFKQSIASKSKLVISKKNFVNKLCRNYFESLLLGHELMDESDEAKDFDFYCAKFLTTMFEGNSIENVNITLLLDALEPLVPAVYFQIIKKRWHSNLKYYMSQYEESYKLLLEAHTMAKANEHDIDDWFIDDILIDLRNRQYKMLEQKNQYTVDNFGQKELSKRNGQLYYPLLDRNEKFLLNWIDKDRQKNDLRSYNTWSSYGDLSFITDHIADFYYQAMMFGSVTHLLRVYTLIQKFTYHLSRTTEYWPSILMMIKSTIANMDHKGAKQISRNFSEILQKMNQEDARDIYKFSMNTKPSEDQFVSNLIAMSEVGYYLSDTDFTNYWNKLEKKIIMWNENADSVVAMEAHIFRCIKRINDRLDDNFIINFALDILSSDKRRYHHNALQLISNRYVDYREINEDNSNKTIDVLMLYANDNNDYNEIEKIQTVFILIENMDVQHREKLEKFIQEKWPGFYSSEYLFEKSGCVESKNILINNLISDINKRNEIQGKNGKFSLYGSDPYLNAMNILKAGKEDVNSKILNQLFIATTETILSSTQIIDEKVSAYRLAIYLLKRHPELIKHNEELSMTLERVKDYSQAKESMISHIDNIVSTLCHQLLLESLGKNKYKEIAETLALFGDSGRQVEGCKIINDFLYNHENVKIRPSLESLILQTVLLWTNATNVDVRWHNVRLQIKFYELKKYRKIIGQNLYSIATTDNAIVKSQVLHRLDVIAQYDSKLAEQIQKTAEKDNNYVIRKIVAN